MLPRGSRRKRKKPSTLKSVFLLAITIVLIVSSGIWGDSGAKAEYVVPIEDIPKLTKVGPIGDYGYPVWYKDSKGKRLELCLEGSNPLCGFVAGDFPTDPNLNVENGNFPGEAFYQLASASIALPSGGDADAVFALEAAWANEIVNDGDQIVFGRVRFRVDDLITDREYTITHPYGVDKIVATAEDEDNPQVGEIRFVEDIGINGGFEGARTSRIGTFLEWDTGAPTGYVGDPNVDHKIKNGYFNGTEEQNYFRIQGPGINSTCNTSSGTIQNCIQTDLFSLMGKEATTSGVDAMRATYSQDTAGSGTIDVFAFTEEDKAYKIDVDVNGDKISDKTLTGTAGKYFGRVGFTGTLPNSITVTNSTDNPVSVKTVTPVDHITGTAKYDTNSETLFITASSSDKLNKPKLTAAGFGDIPASGTLVINKPAYIPPTITITSAANGREVLPVNVTADPALANAGVAQTVKQGSVVTLDGSASSNAKDFAWVQVSGPTVTLNGANTAAPSFVFPTNQTVPVSFKLTVTGFNGEVSTNESIVTITPAPDNVAISSAVFTTSNSTITVIGKSDVGGVTVTVYRGNQTNPKAELLGKATANSTGSWTFKKALTKPMVAGEIITIESSSGGTHTKTVSISTR
ncbi:IPT/TIG domain protein [Neobacillus sp. CF12]|uniref:PKD domain-containing protein n=1 Tax=Neobacillus sp. CF12 TaxID=3055864 RepID=UPI0025A286AB|nr:IPT/TIG domain protein [Neobacillus sp. CF12]MDM5327252.1 IPT/TIG domain protein [Neobacillus sp. CF12]